MGRGAAERAVSSKLLVVTVCVLAVFAVAALALALYIQETTVRKPILVLVTDLVVYRERSLVVVRNIGMEEYRGVACLYVGRSLVGCAALTVEPMGDATLEFPPPPEGTRYATVVFDGHHEFNATVTYAEGES